VFVRLLVAFSLRLTRLFDTVTTREKNRRGKLLEWWSKRSKGLTCWLYGTYILCFGELSFEESIKSGKNIEKRQPLMMNDSQKNVRSASTKPKPMK
jgi:hypothetical protein